MTKTECVDKLMTNPELKFAPNKLKEHLEESYLKASKETLEHLMWSVFDLNVTIED